jgi:acetylornithine/LysW-gamma-L-lysine aminotransferase
VSEASPSLSSPEDTYMLPTYHKLNLVASKGSGVYLYDVKGMRYLDFMAAYGVAILGHCHPDVVEAIKSQAGRLISCHGSLYNVARMEFLETLSRVAPTGLSSFFLCNSGAEAIEAAMKFSRKATGRKRFIAFNGGYHGKTFGALSITSTERYRQPFEPLIEPVTFAEYNNTEGLEFLPWSEAAAVFIEPVQGEAGIKIPTQDFMTKVAKLSRENGALLVVDEIQSGLGRTGKMWAHEHFGITPDIMTIAKGIAGGVPFGVTLVNQDVASHITQGDHSTTFGGNPLACAAATAVLSVIQNRKLVERAWNLGRLFSEELKALSDFRIVKETRSIGLMAAIELRIRFNKVLENALSNGLLTLYAGRNNVRMLPPLIVEEQHIRDAAMILRESIGKVERETVSS